GHRSRKARIPDPRQRRPSRCRDHRLNNHQQLRVADPADHGPDRDLGAGDVGNNPLPAVVESPPAKTPGGDVAMSGEVALGAVVLGVAGGAWLAARSIEAGALVAARSVDLMGAGLIRIGNHAAHVRSEWERDHAAAAEWDTAARKVIDVNA